MYRKIIFISINLFDDIPLFTKATIILFFSTVSVLLVYTYQPFILKKMNILEFYSNLSALLIIYSGILFLEDIGSWIKAFLFATIILVNIFFSFYWLESMLNIILDVHFKFFIRVCPNTMAWFASLLEAINYTKFICNLISYIKAIRKTQLLLYLEYSNNLKISKSICNEKQKTIKRDNFLVKK